MNHTKEHSLYVDPLVDEVRNVRKAISETFDHDVDKLRDYLQHIEQQYQERVIIEQMEGGRQERSEGGI